MRDGMGWAWERWGGAARFVLAALVALAATAPAAPPRAFGGAVGAPLAAHGSHTLNLHGAEVSVGGVPFNSANETDLAGALDTVSANAPRRTWALLTDASSISVFASDPVPAGSTWDLSGAWTFRPYVRISSSGEAQFRARVYRISADGSTTQLLSSTSAMAQTGTSYQLRQWNGTMGANVLQPGERFGVAFEFYPDDGDATGYVGFDHVSAPSNVSAQIKVGYAKQAHYRIGQDSPLSSMTWHAATDAGATAVPAGANVRVRFQVYNDGAANVSWTPQLEWSTSAGSGFAAVPTASGADPFFVADTAQYANGASIATGDFGLGAGTGTAQAGVAYDTANPAGAAITLNAGSYTEIEFNVQANANASSGGTYYFRLTNGGAALAAYDVAAAQVTMQVLGTVREAHYRIGQDAPLASMTWHAAADTAATAIARDANVRVRFQLYNSGDTNVSWAPQLEWTATAGSGYAAVPTTSGAAPFFVADTAQFANGDAIATGDFGLGAGTGTPQTGAAYDAANPAGAALTLTAGSYTEVEFNVQANANASFGGTYYFRLTDAGTPLAAYDTADAQITIQADTGVVREAHYRIGQDSPLTSMTWHAATDALATGIQQGASVRVRFQVYNNGTADIDWTPQLDWTATEGSGYAAVPTASGAEPFFVADTAQFANGDAIATGDFGLGVGTGTAQAGVAYDTANPAGAAITLPVGAYTEIEFNLQANANAALGATYYFRLSNAGAALDGYDTAAARMRMQTPGVVRQHKYRIGQDSNLTSMDWYAAADTAATDVPRSLNLRVRFQVYNDGELTATWTPQLEWTASPGSGYAAVPTASGAEPFFVEDSPFYANAGTIDTSYFGLGAGTGSPQAGIAYDTANPAGEAITLAAGAYTEIDFTIQANTNATLGSSYYFRLTNAGAALSSYVVAEAQMTMQAPCNLCSDHYRIGRDDALSAMTWYASTDTAVTALPRDTNFRVRFQVYNNGAAGSVWTPQLEWSAASGSGYATVPTASGAAPFYIVDSPQFANADAIATGDFGLGAGVGTAQAGIAYDTQNPAGASVTLNGGSYTEIEFSVRANANAAEGGSYYFRLTDSGGALPAYEHPPAEVVVQTAPPPTPTPAPPAHNFHMPYASDTSACAACHRVHTSPAPMAIEKRWPEEQVCFTCHDGTGAPNIMAQFAKTYRMPITSTSGVHTLAEARLQDPAAFTGANRHVECTDCHNPHYAAAGNHTIGSNYAAGPQQGVWGVAPSYTSAWSAPSSWTAVDRITYQYELCFKCHSSWAYGGSPPLSPSGGFTQTDVAKDFNPLNASYMPVIAKGKNPFKFSDGTSYASSLIGGFMPDSTMVCSDCHASETAGDPAGPHGSNNPFILRGAWDRTTGRPGTQNHLCFTCHDWNVYANPNNDRSPWDRRTGFSGGGDNLHAIMVGARNKANNDNPIVCMDCHVAITHGYFRDHLIGFTGDGAPYVNRPYAGGLTTINTWRPSGQWTYDSCNTAMDSCR